MFNDSTQYIARISYVKDSLKMLDVIWTRGLPLDRITTTDVWATDTISANLPEMDAFKAKMDKRIKEQIADLQNELRLAKEQLRRHGCDYCKHEDLDPDEFPCCECSYAGGRHSRWDWAKPEPPKESEDE